MGGAVGAFSYWSYKRQQQRQEVKPAPDQTKIEQPSPSPTPHPYILTSLVIDSVADHKVSFHLQIENGKTPIKHVRANFTSDNYSEIENESYMPRDLQPDGKLSIPGAPLVFKTNRTTSLIVQVFTVLR